MFHFIWLLLFSSALCSCTDKVACDLLFKQLAFKDVFKRGDRLPLTFDTANSTRLYFITVDAISQANFPYEGPLSVQVAGSGIISKVNRLDWRQDFFIVPVRMLHITLEMGRLVGIEWETTTCSGCVCIDGACATKCIECLVQVEVGWKGTDSEGIVMRSGKWSKTNMLPWIF